VISESGNTAPADGQTDILIDVTINDQFGNALEGKTVTLTNTSTSGDEADHPISVGTTAPGVTDTQGVVEFEAADTAAEAVTYTATDTTDGVQVNGSVSITFTAGGANANQSTVTSSPTNVQADGSSTSTLTVSLYDYFGNAVAGKTISVSSLNGSSVIAPVNPVTDASGQATFTVKDATAEVVTYAATDTTDNLLINGQGVVTFGNPPSPPPVAADSTLVASAKSVPADGTTFTTVTVLLYDGNANPVAGKSITLSASGGNSKITAISPISGNDGTATFNVTDSTVESVTYTATDTTDNVPLTGDSVAVTFTSPSSTATSTTTTTTTATSPMSSTTTTTLPPASVASSAGGSATPSATTDASDSGVSSGATLATTGVPPMLPWLVGVGLFLLVVGSSGRRLFMRRAR
jgi:hypothetical protein